MIGRVAKARAVSQLAAWRFRLLSKVLEAGTCNCKRLTELADNRKIPNERFLRDRILCFVQWTFRNRRCQCDFRLIDHGTPVWVPLQ